MSMQSTLAAIDSMIPPGYLDEPFPFTDDELARLMPNDHQMPSVFKEKATPQAPARAKTDKSKRQLEYVLADQLEADATEFSDELIEDLLGRITMSVLYGDSNSGKTFLAIDLGCAVGRQVKWMNRQVEGGMVVYLATESPSSVRNRLRAYQKHHGVKVPNFVIVSSPINLFDSGADTSAVIDLIKRLEADTGCKCELVIGDTLARLSSGANENSGEDMTVVLSHLDRIIAGVKTAILMIHHCGKDAAKGMRGWSGLRAAVDTEMEVTGDDLTGARTLEVTKQREGGKGERIGFRLEKVLMGVGKWGKDKSSCVVVPSDAPAKAMKAAKVGPAQQAILALLKGAGTDMRIKEVAEKLKDQFSKTSVYNASERLKDNALVEISAGVMHLIKS